MSVCCPRESRAWSQQTSTTATHTIASSLSSSCSLSEKALTESKLDMSRDQNSILPLKSGRVRWMAAMAASPFAWLRDARMRRAGFLRA